MPKLDDLINKATRFMQSVTEKVEDISNEQSQANKSTNTVEQAPEQEHIFDAADFSNLARSLGHEGVPQTQVLSEEAEHGAVDEGETQETEESKEDDSSRFQH